MPFKFCLIESRTSLGVDFVFPACEFWKEIQWPIYHQLLNVLVKQINVEFTMLLTVQNFVQLKEFLALLAVKDVEGIKASAPTLLQLLDKMVTKGIIHKNNAARNKSRAIAKAKAIVPIWNYQN